MNILFAASEIFPYAKTGGLADVAYSLPLALKKYTNISRVMPLYGFMDKNKFKFYKDFTITLGENIYKIKVYSMKESIITYFIEAPYLSETANIYGDENGDYKNNALRFGLFCKGVIALAKDLNISLIHLNDWHTALVPLFIDLYKLNIKTLFTIHNLAYQGIFEKSVLEMLGIPLRYFTMDSLEFYSKVNFLKAGIAYSDFITTVSPSYAKEILTKEFGCGLDGFLQKFKYKLKGILNGIDYKEFKPLKDIAKKQKIKKEFYKKFGFKNSKRPLFVMISRLVEQKGIDLLIDSFEELRKENLNLFILGEGELKYCNILKDFSKEYENFYFYKGYDENLSHKTYLASDFLLMPSRFEPCGLNQLIAAASGSVAVVHSVGGLKDTVFENKKLCAQGICYDKENKEQLLSAVQRALKLYKNKEKLKSVIKFNLNCDFSFEKSAKKYLEIYKRLLCN